MELAATEDRRLGLQQSPFESGDVSLGKPNYDITGRRLDLHEVVALRFAPNRPN
jgi:hypothetical protein